jgi:hypothetical protein
MKSSIYEYSDGNNNQYIMKSEKEETIEYIPVKPIHSSSGIYDGGEYVKKVISNLQFEEIKSLLSEAIGKKEIHIKDRVKMSGMILISERGKRRVCILDPYSKEKSVIEKKLQEVIEL